MVFTKLMALVSSVCLFTITYNSACFLPTIYSYCEADGHPRYVEQDKYNGNPFVERTGAEIRFCEAIESWVFMVS